MRHLPTLFVLFVALWCATDAAYAAPFLVALATPPPPDDSTRTGIMGKQQWIAVFCILSLFILVFVGYCYLPKLCLHRSRQGNTTQNPYNTRRRRNHRSRGRSNVASDLQSPTPRREPSPPPSFQEHHLSPLVSPPASIAGSSDRPPSLADVETLVGSSSSGPSSPCGCRSTPSFEGQEHIQPLPPAYPLADHSPECPVSPTRPFP